MNSRNFVDFGRRTVVVPDIAPLTQNPVSEHVRNLFRRYAEELNRQFMESVFGIFEPPTESALTYEMLMRVIVGRSRKEPEPTPVPRDESYDDWHDRTVLLLAEQQAMKR